MTVLKKKSKLPVVKSRWVVKIPLGAKMVVDEGARVKKGEILLTCKAVKISSYNASFVLSRMSSGKLEEIKNSLNDKEFAEGDLLFADGGLFPKKIFSPCSGKFCGIDEFFNIQFQKVTDDRKEVSTPVDAKVLKIEKEKLTLEFNSVKYEGGGIVDGKAWGDGDLKVRDKMSELTSGLKGKIIFSTEPSSAYIIKAGVVGVAGLVVSDSITEIDFSEMDIAFPIMSLAEAEWDRLMAAGEIFAGGEQRMLLNSKVGRLLLVVK